MANGVLSGGSWTFDKLEASSSEIPSGLPDMNAVAFVNNNYSTAYAVGNFGRVIKTTNGGLTWANTSAQPATSEHLNGVSFFSTTTGVVCGNAGTVYKTTNGGGAWTAISMQGATDDFYDIVAWSGSGGDGIESIAVGEGGLVYEKLASASRFTSVAHGAGITSDLFDVEMLSSGTTLRIGGANGAALFRDSGTWTSKTTRSTFPIYKLSFQSANLGMSIGSMFAVARYQ